MGGGGGGGDHQLASAAAPSKAVQARRPKVAGSAPHTAARQPSSPDVVVPDGLQVVVQLIDQGHPSGDLEAGDVLVRDVVKVLHLQGDDRTRVSHRRMFVACGLKCGADTAQLQPGCMLVRSSTLGPSQEAHSGLCEQKNGAGEAEDAQHCGRQRPASAGVWCTPVCCASESIQRGWTECFPVQWDG